VLPLLVNLLAFMAVFLAVFGANALLVDLHSSERRRQKQAVEEQFRRRQMERARSTKLPKELAQLAAEAREENKVNRTLTESLTVLIEQAGLDLPASRLLGMMAGFCLVAGVLTTWQASSLLYGLIAGVIAGASPFLYVAYKRSKRLEKLRSQLPDAFDLMGRVLRAGQTVSQAMKAVADEFSAPVSLEFLYCYEQMNLGLTAEAALRELGRRTSLLEVKIFVLSVVVHRQTGGNLAELLDKLAFVVRERFRIHGMIRSLTAQGRFQAMILLSLPPAMFALLMVLHPQYERTLLEYPMMIFVALAMMTLGAVWIRRIVNFDY